MACTGEEKKVFARKEEESLRPCGLWENMLGGKCGVIVDQRCWEPLSSISNTGGQKKGLLY